MTSTIVQEARVAPAPFVNNLLVNPDFEIWQRGAGPFTSGFQFACDEWRNMTAGGTMNTSRSASALFGSYCASLTNTGNCQFGQGIEAYPSLGGQWLTFSCWIKTSTANAVKLWIRNNAVLSGGDGDAIVAEGDWHPGDNQWHQLWVATQLQEGLKASASTSMPHGYGIQVSVRTEAAVTGCLVDGAVCAVGYYPEGIPFVPLHPAEDMERCTRFYQSHDNTYDGQVWSGPVTSGQNYDMMCNLPTEMVGTPTVTYVAGGQAGFPAGSPTYFASNKGLWMRKVANAANNAGYHWSRFTCEVT